MVEAVIINQHESMKQQQKHQDAPEEYTRNETIATKRNTAC
jgi:hypothetical protein